MSSAAEVAMRISPMERKESSLGLKVEEIRRLTFMIKGIRNREISS
jgi:hypothetical protein